MLLTNSLSIPSWSAIMRMVRQRSVRTNYRTFSMLTSVLTLQGLPGLASSSTLNRPSTNRLCHSKTLVRDMQESPYTSSNMLKVSVAVFPSLTQNLMLVLCSTLNIVTYNTQKNVHLELSKRTHNSMNQLRLSLNIEHILCNIVSYLN